MSKPFNNKKEIYQALLDGKTIVSLTSIDLKSDDFYQNRGTIIRLTEEGFLLTDWSDRTVSIDYDWPFVTPSEFAIYEQPKKKKVFYQMLVKDTLDPQSCWTIPDHLFDESFKDSTGREIYSDRYIRILLTDRPIVIEVDECECVKRKDEK